MKEVRTTFYEVRSYFVPGSIILWAILELINLTGYQAPTCFVGSLSTAIKGAFLIVIAYVMGHGLHSVANFTIDLLPFGSYPPRNYFGGKFQKDFSPEVISSLYAAICKMLTLSCDNSICNYATIEKAYWICFQYTMNQQNAEVENFLGLTGFYRGISSAMLIIFISYSAAWLIVKESEFLFISILALTLFLLFLARMRRFGCYLAKTVYSNFLFLYCQNEG
jgi:hypothetical protein